MLKKSMVILSASVLALAACGQKTDTTAARDSPPATSGARKRYDSFACPSRVRNADGTRSGRSAHARNRS